ncbi:MAG: helix-turn-helix transcriptional regulator [Saccharofermentanales bacterium]
MGEANKFKDFAKNLKRIRKQKNLSQTAIAKKLGVTPQTVSAWENGVSFPKISTIFQLSSILSVEPSRLLSGLSEYFFSTPVAQDDFLLSVNEQLKIEEITSHLYLFNIDGLEKINEYIKDLLNISVYLTDEELYKDVERAFFGSSEEKEESD